MKMSLNSTRVLKCCFFEINTEKKSKTEKKHTSWKDMPQITVYFEDKMLSHRNVSNILCFVIFQNVLLPCWLARVLWKCFAKILFVIFYNL